MARENGGTVLRWLRRADAARPMSRRRLRVVRRGLQYI